MKTYTKKAREIQSPLPRTTPPGYNLEIKETLALSCKTPKQNQIFCSKFTISNHSVSCNRNQLIITKVRK